MKKHPYDFMNQQPDENLEGKTAPEAAAPAEEASKRADDAEGHAEERCGNCESTELAAQRALADAEEIRLRALAEADNARKRFLREKDEATRYAASSVLSDIIPALDNLDLALEHAKGNEACKDFLVGVEMTRKLLLEALQRHGLKPVGAVGEIFDPAVHEALSMAPHDEVPNGAICMLMTRGYMLHDRLLRPAKVVVCKK